MSKFAACFLSLVVANFGYQYFGEQNYGVAFDRSAFQLTALFCYAVLFDVGSKS